MLNKRHCRQIAAFLLIVALCVVTHGDEEPGIFTIDLKPVPEGSLSRLNRMESRSAAVTSKVPDAVKKPVNDDAAVYGVLPLGVTKQGMLVAVTESADSTKGKLYLDSNGDGDLTNDPPPDYWDARGVSFEGMATIRVDGIPVKLRLFRYTSKFAETSPSLKKKNPLFYAREDVREGKLTLGKKTYLVLIKDLQVSGRYDQVSHEGKDEVVGLYIDRNDDGKYDLRDELYDLAFPFAIDGRILELSQVAADGSRLVLKTVGPGATDVTERPVKFAVGLRAPDFEAKLLDDKTVTFPGDYSGKIVLLTFWSTGCAPCRRVIADEVRTYERFKAEGFEVLGVSLDPVSRTEAVRTFCTEWGMTWPQILNGEGFDSSVARRYDVQSMPHGILVDGTTGKVLAMPETLKQDGVAATIRRVLTIREALRNN